MEDKEGVRTVGAAYVRIPLGMLERGHSGRAIRPSASADPDRQGGRRRSSSKRIGLSERAGITEDARAAIRAAARAPSVIDGRAEEQGLDALRRPAAEEQRARGLDRLRFSYAIDVVGR
jgi:hypothetical protein